MLSFRCNLVRALVIAMALASLSIPAGAQTVTLDRSTVKADLSKIRIDNFGQVDAAYYRGAQPKGTDYENLAALGVKTLIDLTGDDGDPGEQAMAARAGMQYVHIPMTTHQSPTTAQLEQFLAVVNDPARQPVYVHCVGGRHRTGVMTAVYRMTHDGWAADRAFAEMKRYKFGADMLHGEFKEFVYAYQPAPAVASSSISAAATRTK
jgi:uncharacterized protein (TIGR01244 family)